MKHTKAIIVAVLFSLLTLTHVNAADTTVGMNAVPVELKYAGTYKNQPVLMLNFFGYKRRKSIQHHHC